LVSRTDLSETDQQCREADITCDVRFGSKTYGLRAMAVINLRRAGLSYAQIGRHRRYDARMVEHYCRNADMRSTSHSALAMAR
jgi:DNA-binding CsgD family transcriptional regulator